MEEKLKVLAQNGGPEISIVTLPSLNDKPIEMVSRELFDKWRIGKLDKDNGLLLLIAMKERKVRIETGYGLEAQITDGVAGQIIREDLAPELSKGNYEMGTTQALNAITYKLELTPMPPKKSKGRLWLVFVLAMIFIVVMSRGSPKGRGGGPFISNGGFRGGGFGGFGGGRGGGGGASGGF